MLSQTHDVALRSLSQQPPKCDDRRHAGTVEEEDGGQTLQAQRVPDVAPVERHLPLNIHDQTSKYPKGQKGQGNKM